MTYRPKNYTPKPEDLKKNLDWMERVKKDKEPLAPQVVDQKEGFATRVAARLGFAKKSREDDPKGR